MTQNLEEMERELQQVAKGQKPPQEIFADMVSLEEKNLFSSVEELFTTKDNLDSKTDLWSRKELIIFTRAQWYANFIRPVAPYTASVIDVFVENLKRLKISYKRKGRSEFISAFHGGMAQMKEMIRQQQPKVP